MKTLFHYAASEKIKAMLAPYVDADFQIACAPEGVSEPFLSELSDSDVIWHVLQPLTADVLRIAPNLKLVQKIGVGVNTIDVEFARDNGIAVCNMPGTNSRAVAEMVLLLILSSLRRLPIVDGNLRRGQWAQGREINDSLREIAGLTVGFIGFGQIPQILAPILTAMGADVIYVNRSAKDSPYERMSLEDVAARADVLSLHVPLTQDTEKMVTAAFLAKMKPGSIFINTARGELVDEKALYAALSDGHISAAGLDVFDGEPLKEVHPLFELDNVTVTPHIGWLTEQTWQRSLEIAVYNAKAVMSRAPLKYQVA